MIVKIVAFAMAFALSYRIGICLKNYTCEGTLPSNARPIPDTSFQVAGSTSLDLGAISSQNSNTLDLFLPWAPPTDPRGPRCG
jgi:hypothetical protein